MHAVGPVLARLGLPLGIWAGRDWVLMGRVVHTTGGEAGRVGLPLQRVYLLNMDADSWGVVIGVRRAMALCRVGNPGVKRCLRI